MIVGKDAKGEESVACLWLIRGGENGQYESMALNKNVVNIGYGGLPGIHLTNDYEKFRQQYINTHPEDSTGRVNMVVPQIWNFIQEIKKGDFIVMPLMSQDSKYIAIGQIVGDYEYSEHDSEIRQFRRVKWS